MLMPALVSSARTRAAPARAVGNDGVAVVDLSHSVGTGASWSRWRNLMPELWSHTPSPG